MSNKKLGIDFEQEMIKLFASRGYWVREMFSDRAGNQPFDVLAMKYGETWAFDCKTETKKTFSYNRIEENQRTAMEYFSKINPWAMVGFFIKHEGQIYWLDFVRIDFEEKGIKINECICGCEFIG